MQLPGLCRDCGRTIAKDFIFCPWCGVSQITGDLVPVGAPRRNSILNNQESGLYCYESNRLRSITRQLDDLERDFMLFAMKREHMYDDR